MIQFDGCMFFSNGLVQLPSSYGIFVYLAQQKSWNTILGIERANSFLFLQFDHYPKDVHPGLCGKKPPEQHGERIRTMEIGECLLGLLLGGLIPNSHVARFRNKYEYPLCLGLVLVQFLMIDRDHCEMCLDHYFFDASTINSWYSQMFCRMAE